MRILVTRPRPDGERTAAALRAAGHDALLAPLMRIAPVAADLDGAWSTVIVTSANALRALTPGRLAPLLKLPLFAVGSRSAEAARAAGFSDVRSAQGDAGDLARLIASRAGAGNAPHLYLAGEDRAADLKAALAPSGIDLRVEVVYRAVALGYPPELVAALDQGQLDAAVHFSRRAADAFLAGARDAALSERALALRHFCLSPQVAEPLNAAGAASIAVARRPDEAALIALVGGTS